MPSSQRSLALATSDRVYARCDHSLWRFAVYDGVHGGRELANICGVQGLDAVGALISTKASRVLDVGCGSGDACIYIAEKFGCEVVGADINQSQISRACKKLQAVNGPASCRVSFVCADVAKRQPVSFDLVYSFDSLTLVSDLPEILKSIRLALRPAAAFFWTDVFAGPNLDEETREFAWSEDGMINLMDRASASEMLQQCGFAEARWLDRTDMAAQVFSVICERLEQFDGVAGRMEEDLLQEWQHASELYRDAFSGRRLEYLWCTALA